MQTDFSFDAGGNRARQLKQRLNQDTSSIVEETLYLGAYEREIHSTKSAPAAPMVLTRTVHRHTIGGFAVYTRTDKPGLPSETKLTTILKDHLGSTDVLYTGTWIGSTFSIPTPASIERQSFDPWGERRAPSTLVAYRTTDADPFRTSNHDYDRGYTSHEQLDDSGLIHMNGRIYDPELGRMLSPDPFVQVPEYSQNFNRYSYVMNNPLNLTDPTGFNFISNFFKKIGNWIKENWRTIVVIVVAAILVMSGLGSVMFAGLWGALGGGTVAAGSALSIIGTGAVVGAITGGLGAALAGGSLGDVLRGALIGGIAGALTGALHGVGGLANIVGHGVVGGLSNVAMGGKFGDGFLSAAASAATAVSGLTNPGSAAGKSLGFVGRTAVASAAGGTASAIGGGKFANGAYTGAFQYLVTSGVTLNSVKNFANAVITIGTAASEFVYKTLISYPLGNFPPEFNPNPFNKQGFACGNYVGGNRVNGLNDSQGDTDAHQVLRPDQIGPPYGPRPSDQLQAGGLWHDRTFAWATTLGPFEGITKSGADILLAIKSIVGIFNIGPVQGWRPGPVVPSLMTAAGMFIASPLHAANINP